MTTNGRLGGFQPKSAEMMSVWPALLTGNSSATPWMMPKTIAWTYALSNRAPLSLCEKRGPTCARALCHWYISAESIGDPLHKQGVHFPVVLAGLVALPERKTTFFLGVDVAGGPSDTGPLVGTTVH